MNYNKNYKSSITKNYIKKNSLLLFFFTTYQNINSWLNTKQNLKNMQFKCFGVFKNILKKIFKKSIYINFQTLSSQTIILLMSNKYISIFWLNNNFNFLLLNVLAIRLNNKIYNINQLKNNFCFQFTMNQLLILKFIKVNLKKSSK